MKAESKAVVKAFARVNDRTNHYDRASMLYEFLLYAPCCSSHAPNYSLLESIKLNAKIINMYLTK